LERGLEQIVAHGEKLFLAELRSSNGNVDKTNRATSAQPMMRLLTGVLAYCSSLTTARGTRSTVPWRRPFGITNCRACHGGAYAGDKVATTCIACHDYHQSATLKMGAL